jgi:ribonucleotide reductase alpha subunit
VALKRFLHLFVKECSILDNDEMYEVNPYFEKLAKENSFYSQELIDKIYADLKKFRRK